VALECIVILFGGKNVSLVKYEYVLKILNFKSVAKTKL